jgi:hypothetical protein
MNKIKEANTKRVATEPLSFEDALPYAIAAFQLNGGRYTRSTVLTNARGTANSCIMKKLIRDKYQPTVEQLKMAVEIGALIRLTNMSQNSKATANTNFFKKVTELSTKSVMTIQDMGLLAYLPEMHREKSDTDSIMRLIKKINNKPIGTIGQKVSLIFDVIKTCHVPSIKKYKTVGVTKEGQAVYFYYDNLWDKLEGEDICIDTCIREMSEDGAGNLITQLGYANIRKYQMTI